MPNFNMSMSMTSFVVVACKKCKLCIWVSCSRHCLYLYIFSDPDIVVICTFGLVHLSCSGHHLYSYIFHVPDIVHVCTSGAWEIHIYMHAHMMSIFFTIHQYVLQFMYIYVSFMFQTLYFSTCTWMYLSCSRLWLYCYIFHVAGVD